MGGWQVPCWKGKWVLFTSRNNSAMRISRIRIREWDGSLPNGDKEVMGNGKEDYVRFSNGDGFSGKILRMRMTSWCSKQILVRCRSHEHS